MPEILSSKTSGAAIQKNFWLAKGWRTAASVKG